MSDGFAARSHKKHAEHFENDLIDAERIKISKSWFDKNTADYWRHARAYEFLDCFADTGCSWLTIGDGRWGLDSIRIKEKGFSEVLPTDICPALLRESKRLGHIHSFFVENAEKLSFSENSFDYVFCKESFHHFPRPYLALYEMLCVARKGVFCIEPNGDLPSLAQTPLTIKCIMKNFVKDCLSYLFGIRWVKASGEQQAPTFETSGNYVYTLSKYEAYKIAYGINLPQLAFSGLNDHYVPGVEFEPADAEKSALFREITERVRSKDEACRNGTASYDLLMVGFLKEPLIDEEVYKFCERGWEIVNLQRNPYL